MKDISFELDSKANPARVHAEHLGANAPDLASTVFQHLRAECERDAGATCPLKSALLKGRCPAGSSEPCPYAPEAGVSRSLHAELGYTVGSTEAERAGARERAAIREQAKVDEANAAAAKAKGQRTG